ncbi:hypothetical protein D3C75_1313550 [compost metagenome]
MLRPELAACGGNISALLPPDRGIDFVAFQNSLEVEDIIPGSSHIIPFLDEVHRDQIHVA